MGKSLFENIYLPLPSPVQQMKERGNLKEAEAYLKHLLETGEYLPEERQRFRAELEILRRLPAEYPYTRAEALELVRRYVPNFSEADFDSSRKAEYFGAIWTVSRAISAASLTRSVRPIPSLP